MNCSVIHLQKRRKQSFSRDMQNVLNKQKIMSVALYHTLSHMQKTLFKDLKIMHFTPPFYFIEISPPFYFVAIFSPFYFIAILDFDIARALALFCLGQGLRKRRGKYY